ncbi:hypothetical protein BCR33DRAFT_851053, partial [Rhizoclosmatium globosum]
MFSSETLHIPLPLAEAVVLATTPEEKAAAVSRLVPGSEERRRVGVLVNADLFEEYSQEHTQGYTQGYSPQSHSVRLPSARALEFRRVLSNSLSGVANDSVAELARFATAEFNPVLSVAGPSAAADVAMEDASDEVGGGGVGVGDSVDKDSVDLAKEANEALRYALTARTTTALVEPAAWPRVIKMLLADSATVSLSPTVRAAQVLDILNAASYSSQFILDGEDLLPAAFNFVFNTLSPSTMPPLLDWATIEQMDLMAASNSQLWSTPGFVEKFLDKLGAKVLTTNPTDGLLPTESNVEGLITLDKFATVALHDAGMNSVKSSIVFRLLQFKLTKLRVYDIALFERYIQMPRVVDRYQTLWGDFFVSLTPVQSTSMKNWSTSIFEERQLVTHFLLHIFKTDPSKTIESYSKWINKSLVQENFAAVKICLTDEGPKYNHLLTPSQLQDLTQSIVLEFDPIQRPDFLVPFSTQKTVLPLNIKNISTLEVNEYEINTFALYKSNGNAVTDPNNTVMALDLTGVVPHRSRLVQVGGGSFSAGRLYSESVEVPWLDGVERGLVVVEVVGGGKRCRAVLQKGVLRVVEKIALSGHVFSVVDEKNEVIQRDFNVYMAGHTYEPNEEGTIAIPFTRSAKLETLIITYKGYSYPAQFNHLEESYQMQARWLFNREAVRAGNTLTVAVKPLVTIGSNRIAAKLRDLVPGNRSHGEGSGPLKAKISVKVVAADGLESVKLLEGVDISDEEDTTFDVNIPAKVRSMEFVMSLVVRKVSQKEDVELKVSKFVELNKIDETSTIETSFLEKSDTGYKLRILGRNGEPFKKYSVEVYFKHRHVVKLMSRVMHTDSSGVINLGLLEGVAAVGVIIGETPAKVWNISGLSPFNPVELPSGLLTIAEDERIVIPLRVPAEYLETSPELWDLYQKDTSQALVLSTARHLVSFVAVGKNLCELVVSSGLKKGSYEMRIYTHYVTISVHDTKALTLSNTTQVLSTRAPLDRLLQFDLNLNPKTVDTVLEPARISSTTYTPQTGFQVKLSNVTPSTRVHCLVSYLGTVDSTSIDVSTYAPGDVQRRVVDAKTLGTSYSLTQSLNPDLEYVLKRKRDVIERKGIIGNTLQKPSALLDTWKVRSTSLLDSALDGTVVNESLYAPQAEFGGAFGGFTGAPIMRAAMAAPLGDYARERASFKKKRSGKPTTPRLEYLSSLQYDFTNYDFLAKNGASLFNLKPDSDGSLVVPLNETQKCEVLFVVVDGNWTSQVKVQINEDSKQGLVLADTAVRPSWPVSSNITEVLANTALDAGSSLPLSLGSDFALVSTLPKLFSVAESMISSSADTLSKFKFITSWNTLSYNSKISLFSEYSCHELNVFLYFKDPEFFKTVVKPHLQSKSCKSYVDFFLLDDVEACKRAIRNTSGIWNNLNLVEKILLARVLVQHGLGDSEEVHIVKSWVTNLYNKECKNGPYAAAKSDVRAKIFAILLNAAETESKEEMLLMEDSDDDMGFQLDGLDSPRPAPGASFSRTMAFRAEPPAPAPVAAVPPQSQFFEPPPETSELAERHYWNESRWNNKKDIEINDFWNDFLTHVVSNSSKPGFFSENVGDVLVGDFTEIMFALSILNVGFADGATAIQARKVDQSLAILAKTPCIVYHKEYKESSIKTLPSIICNVQYFDPDNAEVQDEDSLEWIPRYIDPQSGHKFLAGKVYAMQVTLTNTMAIPYLVSALVAIPAGSLAVKCSPIKTHRFTLQPFKTILETYHFYFAAAGAFEQYPVRLADRKNVIISSSTPQKLIAVETVEKAMLMDGAGGITWPYLAEHGSDEEVLAWLQNPENVLHGDMVDDVLFRFNKNGEFWLKVVKVLKARGVYSDQVWAFGVKYQSREHIVEWLITQKPNDLPYVQVGDVVVDDFVTGDKDVYSYWPLINARAHEIGHRARANNKEFVETYSAFLEYLLVKPATAYSCKDHISLICYLLLQDRFKEALDRFSFLESEVANNRVVVDMQIQFDYLKAWFDFIDPSSSTSGADSLKIAREIANKYKDYPVKNWNELFTAVLARADEFIAFFTDARTSETTATNNSAKSALSEPSLTFGILHATSTTQASLSFSYNNIRSCEVKFYSLNLEMEFSTRPFVVASRFKGETARNNDSPSIMTQPHHSITVQFPTGSGELTVQIPTDVQRGNLAVEVFALNGAISQMRVASESSLKVSFMERKGILQVLKGGSSNAGVESEWAITEAADVRLLAPRDIKPVGSAYVKVYARLRSGKEVFYKDGYSDMLGRFEYVSLSNTGVLSQVELFAVYVSSEAYGDAVFTAKPPKV